MKTTINIATVAITLLIFACGPSDQPTESAVSRSQGTDGVALTSEQMQTARIKTAHIQQRLIGEKVHVSGMFDVPPQNRAQVSSMADAFVKKTSLLIGDRVYAGQELVWLHHPELIRLQNDFLERYQRLQFLKSEYDRQLELDRNRINAKKNLMKAESDYKGMLASVSAYRENLKLLGIDPEKVIVGRIYREVSLRSPINGYVTKVNVSIGSMAKVGEPIFEIIDPEHLHIELKVFEKDVIRIQIEEPFTFSISGDTTTYLGEIYLIGQQLNADRTVDIHGHIDEKLGRFIPGMYVEAEIYVSMDTVTAVPETALFETEGQYYVYIATGERRFKMAEITIGKTPDGWVEILEGDLKPEDDIVVEGVYFLSSVDS